MSHYEKLYIRSGGNPKYRNIKFIKNEGDFQNLKFDFEEMYEIE